MQKASVIRASAWSVTAEISAKVVGPVSFLILAKLLTPADFGTMAAANSLLGFTAVLTDMGISKVIIQKNGTSEYLKRIEHAGLWLNVALGAFFSAVIVLFSGELARLFGQPHASAVIAVLSLQVLLTSLSSIRLALLRKELKFKSLFYLRIVYITTPLAVSLPLAFAGAGYWSMAGGQLAAAGCILVMAWRGEKIRSFLTVDIKALRSILPDSTWITVEQVAIWTLLMADAFFIGRLLSPSDLGVYSLSRTLFYAAITLSLGAIMPVLFSYFSKISDVSVLKKNVLLSQRFSFLLVALMGMAVFLFAPLVEQVFFSSNWKGLAAVTGTIFLFMGISYFTFSIVEALKSRGLFRPPAINTAVCVLVSLPVLYYSVSFGLVTYVLVRCILQFLQFPAVFVLSGRHLGISFADCLYNCRYMLGSICFILLLRFLIPAIPSNQLIIYVLYLIALIVVLLINVSLEKAILRKLFVPKT